MQLILTQWCHNTHSKVLLYHQLEVYGPLQGSTSSWKPFRPLYFVFRAPRALKPSDTGGVPERDGAVGLRQAYYEVGMQFIPMQELSYVEAYPRLKMSLFWIICQFNTWDNLPGIRSLAIWSDPAGDTYKLIVQWGTGVQSSMSTTSCWRVPMSLDVLVLLSEITCNST